MNGKLTTRGWRDSGPNFGRVSRWLHWGFVGVFFVAIPLGIWGANAQIGPLQLVLLTVHKSLGVGLGVFWLFRLSWRLSQGWPDAITDSRVLNIAAKVAHWGLYALILSAVLSGWAYSNAAAFPVSFFGLFELPTLLPANEIQAARLKQLHHLVVFALLGLVALHLIAAFYHHRYLRDDSLRRMLGR